MFPRWAIMIALLVTGMQYFLEYRDWLDWNKKVILRVSPGPCTTVVEDGGAEELLHIGNNIILMTQGFSFDFETGYMSVLDLNKGNTVTRLNMTNVPNREDFMAAPHGMTSWEDPETGQLFIYVLTHSEKEDRIEVFEVSKTLTLTYVKTIKDPLFSYMNNLVAVGKDKFYITSIFLYRTLPMITMEVLLRIRNGRILYYDGRKAREVATGYLMANGISMSPDKTMIYMAECGYKKVHAYKRLENNELQHMWEYDADSIVDNIDVDPATGDLWIGSHPVGWKIFDFYKIFSSDRPSHVIRIKLRENMVSEVEEVYSDDGAEISACTVAVYVDGKLVIGSVSEQAIVCDVKYLSP